MTSVRKNVEVNLVLTRARDKYIGESDKNDFYERLVWIARAVSTEKGEMYRYYFVLRGTNELGDKEAGVRKDIAVGVPSDNIKLAKLDLLDTHVNEYILRDPIYVIDVYEEKFLMFSISDTDLNDLNRGLREYADQQILIDELDKRLPS